MAPGWVCFHSRTERKYGAEQLSNVRSNGAIRFLYRITHRTSVIWITKPGFSNHQTRSAAERGIGSRSLFSRKKRQHPKDAALDTTQPCRKLTDGLAFAGSNLYMPGRSDSPEPSNIGDRNEDLEHPRGTLAIVIVFGLLFMLGWLAIFILFLQRGAPHS